MTVSLPGLFERFTDRARRVITLADKEAREMNHESVGTGHLLIALLAEGEAVAFQALSSFGVTKAAAREAVLGFAPAGEAAPAGQLAFTPRLKKVTELALRESLQLGCNYVGTEHLLLGLIREGDGAGMKALASLGADPGRVRRKVTDLLLGYAKHAGTGRTYQVTVRETALGDIRLGHGKLGPHVVIVGPKECVHHVTADQARAAAAALTAVADEIDANQEWPGLPGGE